MKRKVRKVHKFIEDLIRHYMKQVQLKGQKPDENSKPTTQDESLRQETMQGHVAAWS